MVIGAAQSAIEHGEPKLVRITNDRIQPEEDVEQYTMSCASNGTIELFIQPYSARSALCVLGSTPAADEARFLAERLQDPARRYAGRSARRPGRDAGAGRRGSARGAPCAARQRTC